MSLMMKTEYHKVKITDTAVEASVDYAVKYITDRQLPDKSIDVLDRASAKAKIFDAFKDVETKDIQEPSGDLYNSNNFSTF